MGFIEELPIVKEFFFYYGCCSEFIFKEVSCLLIASVMSSASQLEILSIQIWLYVVYISLCNL